ncbi:MAG: DUF5060 domain-containing protein, partial [Draconibacterium sp.]|nr:DUF5060 domain-containing protein [Draconibacterium sp.]
MQTKLNLILLLFVCIILSCSTQNQYPPVEKWEVFELELVGPSEGNPYMEIDLKAIFTLGEKSLKVPGFYDGEGKYFIRFSPEKEGEWTFVTESNSEELNGITGKFESTSATGENHGPLKIVNTYYLEYADESPWYGIGTTAYQWTSVKQSIQEQTLETLENSPFNKIRMCVFPKNYRYGNDTEPWIYPYKKEGEQSDYTQPNYEFFRNFDKRVEQLKDLGVQADVILFHPYDIWGYFLMGDELNERYVRYMIA